ncbi:MAG: SDR family oxidoreductase [Rhodospirillaceae bacterium]|jgi:3-oxoacyl-[acyl-carrier protein] reductase|nr:SDR family oxidoreductase [Rhodospirillaceae bacterium]
MVTVKSPDQSNELAGKAAIVTGSARNIGRAIACDLAAGGAAVLINGRTSKAEADAVAADINSAGGRATVFMGDIGVPDIAQAMVDHAVSEFGRLDFLVNNVSQRGECPLSDMSFDLWKTVLSGTLDTAFLCTKAALPHLRKSGAASIVNMGGVASHAGFPERAHVAAAKAGLGGMTGALAPELAGDKITVNCVVPALINTDRGDGSIPPHYATRPIPMNRPGEPEEVAALVRFLCGPGARFISGQTMHVNGAWHVTI